MYPLPASDPASRLSGCFLDWRCTLPTPMHRSQLGIDRKGRSGVTQAQPVIGEVCQRHSGHSFRSRVQWWSHFRRPPWETHNHLDLPISTGSPKGPSRLTLMRTRQFLTDRGYAASTFSNCIGSVAHFAQWLHGRRLRIRSLNEAVVAEFLDEHLPLCGCAGPVLRDRRTLSAALGHLLVVLRARGVVAPPTVRTTPVDEELRRYDEYMDHVRGLAPKTRGTRLRIVGRLLASRFGDGAIDIAAIKPDHVRRFFAQQAKLYSKPANAGSVVATLRGYFRYRATLGDRGTRVDRRVVLSRQLAAVLATQDTDSRRSRATGRLARPTRPLHAAR